MFEDQDKNAFKIEAQRRRDEGLKLFGQTFDIKDQIKNSPGGGIWDNRLRTWLVSSREVAESLGGVRKEGQHGVYYMIGKSKRDRADNSGPAPAPAQAKALKHGDLCPACKEETLDAETRPGELICWDCGYRS